MDSEHLQSAGRALFGEEWQTPLARALGPVHPEGARVSIDPRLMRRWAAGNRPIPDWVEGALAALARQSEGEAAQRLALLRKLGFPT